ncbi:MAG: hypothetical protein ABIB04_03915 [Patescibacteria group bacterium]
MKRFYPVIISICLGALAVAIGMGFFLKKANTDRERLTEIALKAERESKDAVLAKENAIKQANQKLDTANNEISKAQDIIKSLQEERDMLTNATSLRAPSGLDIKGWKEAINLPLAVSIKYPGSDNLEANDKNALTIAKNQNDKNDFTLTADNRWLSITTYEERLENELMGMFVSSTPLSYNVGGHLLIGYSGTTAGSADSHLVFHVQYNGQKTHLIWMREIDRSHNFTTLQKALATLTFAK